MQQHDDHIWLTVNGEGWAIRSIIRDGDSITFDLWRGYWPDIETACVIATEVDWPRYCAAAVAVIDAQERPLC